MSNYYVYIGTENEKSCPKFNSLDDALAKYNATEMNNLRDSVFLGMEEYDSEHYCFDVLHKFYKDNVLINDYTFHDSTDVLRKVHEIMEMVDIKYQFTSEILGGVLIDYASPVDLMESKRTEEKWNEAFIETLVNDQLKSVGWVKPSRETQNNYGWQWPVHCSYIPLINVSVYDARGYKHDVDMDPRTYLALCNKRISLPYRKED